MTPRGKGLGVSPNFRRQAGYVAIAFLAVLGGYGAGVLFKTKPQGSLQFAVSTPQELETGSERSIGKPLDPKKPAPLATNDSPNTPVYPDPLRAQTEIPVRAYEEALPSEVYESALRDGVTGNPSSLAAGSEFRLPEPTAEMTASALLPPWRRYAVAFPEAGQRPKVVIVIDDLGMDRKRTARAMGLRGPLTLSFLPYAEDLDAQTAVARGGGHELLMHVGMEPVGENIDPGPDVLRTGLDSEMLRLLLEKNLGRFEGYVGINNHMGSRFTADVSGMTLVMEILKRRGLLFLDSRTTGRSVGVELAREAGVPVAERNIFLDNVNETAAISARLQELEQLARRRGYAVAIGHPRDATLDALEGWLKNLEDRGLALVPLSAVVATNQGGKLRSAVHNPNAPQVRDWQHPGAAYQAEGAGKGKM